MDEHYHRGSYLMEARRYSEAADEFRLSIAQDPEYPVARAMLSICLSVLERFPQAIKEGKEAVRLGPDLSFCHYALAIAFCDAGNTGDARKHIQEAIRLDPEDPDYYAIAAVLSLKSDKWKEAVDWAGQGLSIDPEHVHCINYRAQGLLRLGRSAEADEALDVALAEDPEDSDTHANKGWVWLRRGNAQKAFEFFREALRLDPNSQWAREGVMEALKARHPMYRPVLATCFWLECLDRRFLLPVLIFVPPLRLLYFFLWIVLYASNQTFNLLLRFDPFGKTVLNEADLRYNNFFLVLVAGLTGFLIYCQVTDYSPLDKEHIAMYRAERFARRHDLEQAQKYYTKTLRLVDKLVKEGRFRKADNLYSDLIKSHKEYLGENDAALPVVLIHAARSKTLQNKSAEAEALLKQAASGSRAAPTR